MPTIIVQADTADEEPQLRERVPAALMVDPRAAGRLVERIAVALLEAERSEQNVR